MKASNPMRRSPLLTLCALAALGAGCADPEERWESADFGNSVRNTIALQTDHANSAGTGLDGQKAEAVLNAYRTDVAQPKVVEKELVIGVSQ
jgi:hypothetical protein